MKRVRLARSALPTEMHEWYNFVLPLPPSVNHAFPTINGRRVMSPEYRRWKEEVDILLPLCGIERRTRRRNHWAVEYGVFLPDRRSDIDNRVKGMIDTVGRYLGLDDRYLERLEVVRGECQRNEVPFGVVRVEVYV